MTEINHLFWRFVYLGACWWIALKPVLIPSPPGKVDPTGILSTMFLFFMPLLIDYWGFITITKLAKRLRKINYIVTISCIIFIGFALLQGGSPLNVTAKTLYGIDLKIIWYGSFIWVVLAFIDWITLSVYPKEAKAQKKLQKVIQKEQNKILKETPLQKRISYYEKQLEKNGGVDV